MTFSQDCKEVYDTVVDEVCTTVNINSCNNITEPVCQPTYGTRCNPVFSEVCRQVTRQVCDADILVEKCGIVDETNCDTVFDTQVTNLSISKFSLFFSAQLSSA